MLYLARDSDRKREGQTENESWSLFWRLWHLKSCCWWWRMWRGVSWTPCSAWLGSDKAAQSVTHNATSQRKAHLPRCQHLQYRLLWKLQNHEHINSLVLRILCCCRFSFIVFFFYMSVSSSRAYSLVWDKVEIYCGICCVCVCVHFSHLKHN